MPAPWQGWADKDPSELTEAGQWLEVRALLGRPAGGAWPPRRGHCDHTGVPAVQAGNWVARLVPRLPAGWLGRRVVPTETGPAPTSFPVGRASCLPASLHSGRFFRTRLNTRICSCAEPHMPHGACVTDWETARGGGSEFAEAFSWDSTTTRGPARPRELKLTLARFGTSGLLRPLCASIYPSMGWGA